MPVQDNEDKRAAAEHVTDAEEELRRQKAQTQKQTEETCVQKSGKLLPFLNAKAELHQSRINVIDEKIENQTDKIDRNRAKIEALTARADKLEDTNRMLKATLGSYPIVKKLIESNEKRIQTIREEKIANCEEKVRQGRMKINRLTDKRSVISHKLNRVTALSDAVKSFSIGYNKERREAFSEAMNRLNEATYHCLTDKKNALLAKRDTLIEKYNAPETASADKLKIQEQINNLSIRIQNVENRIDKAWEPDEYYKIIPDAVKDAQMELTSEKLADMTDSGMKTVPELAENTLFAAKETDELSAEQIESLGEKFRSQTMAKVEEMLEDDANMIDGIINNGRKSSLDKINDDEHLKGEHARSTVKPKAISSNRTPKQNNIRNGQENAKNINGHAYFSRSRLKNDVQRIKARSVQNTEQKQTERKKNNQELD